MDDDRLAKLNRLWVDGTTLLRLTELGVASSEDWKEWAWRHSDALLGAVASAGVAEFSDG